MDIVVWRDKAASLCGMPDYPVLSVVVDKDVVPINIVRYLVFKRAGAFPYSFLSKEKAEAFFNAARSKP